MSRIHMHTFIWMLSILWRVVNQMKISPPQDKVHTFKHYILAFAD